MSTLRSREEVSVNSTTLYDTYCFYLAKKGFRKTIIGEHSPSEIAEIKAKYNLAESISDYDFGFLEGKIKIIMLLETFFDTYDSEWIDYLITANLVKICCFILKCATDNPQLSATPSYDYAGQLKLLLEKAEPIKDECCTHMKHWHYTLYEFGFLCGFANAAHWAIGKEWAFKEDDFSTDIDWKRFHNYLGKRSAKLKKRKVQELSEVFQILISTPYEGGSNIGKAAPMHNIRRKSFGESSDTMPPIPELPKPENWLDW